jgi:hypothetical protein
VPKIPKREKPGSSFQRKLMPNQQPPLRKSKLKKWRHD